MASTSKKYSVFIGLVIFTISCTKHKTNPTSNSSNPTPVDPGIKVSWQKLPSVTMSADAIFNINDNFYISTGNMIYRSTDSCTTWNWIANFGTYYFVENGSKLIAGGREFGVHVSTNNGISWTNQGSFGLSGQDIRGLVRIDTTLYTGIYSGGAFFSTNNGLNWSSKSIGLPPDLAVTSMFVKDTALFAGTLGVYRFNKQNSIWVQSDHGIPEGFYVRSFGANDSIILAAATKGLNEHSIFVSSDGGFNWIASNKGIPDYVNNLIPTSIIVSGRYIFEVIAGHLLVSTDNCKSWNQVVRVPSQKSVFSVTVYHDYLYAICLTYSESESGGVGNSEI